MKTREETLEKIANIAKEVIYETEVLQHKWTKVGSKRLRRVLNTFRKDIVDYKRTLSWLDDAE
jgi:hypothetical protein